MKPNLKNKIIGVIGLGYVGLPLAVEFGKKRTVIGFDVNKKRINELKTKIDSTFETSSEELNSSNKLTFTSNESDLEKADIYIITVPTPIDKSNKPDLSYLISASEIVGRNIKKGDVVIYESTVYPGTTEEICIPVIEKISNFKCLTKDKKSAENYFYCGYSPERINPGDKSKGISDILKITSGSTKNIAIEINNLYSEIITAGTYLAPSIKVAESAKVIENIQRDLNIALMNELAIIFDKLDISTNEVLKAAGTKWNFINFHPGLVGGHCIGVDPYYLTHKAESVGYIPQVILSGRKINEEMPNYVASKLLKYLLNKDLNPVKKKCLILGTTFKENCADIRNSKVFNVIDQLNLYGISCDIVDPLACKDEVKKECGISIKRSLPKKFLDYHSVILAVPHKQFEKINIPKDVVFFDLRGNSKYADIYL